MSGGGATPPRRRRRFLSSFFLLIFFIWVVFCHHRHQATAVARPFPGNQKPEQSVSGGAGSKEKLLRTYFNGRSFGSRGFQEKKRTVPSCPDPLHN
ncbi:hypothetical protein SDJN02_21899, partial [Cucurbita argyrosperma subsp. argyrosperma]